jgi:hypothetical protein
MEFVNNLASIQENMLPTCAGLARKEEEIEKNNQKNVKRSEKDLLVKSIIKFVRVDYHCTIHGQCA